MVQEASVLTLYTLRRCGSLKVHDTACENFSSSLFLHLPAVPAFRVAMAVVLAIHVSILLW